MSRTSQADEATAFAGIVLLVAERCRLPSRVRNAAARENPRARASNIPGRPCRRRRQPRRTAWVRRRARSRSRAEPDLASLHGIVGIVRRDVLVLGLDAGKQLGDEIPLAELIAGERGEEGILAVERGRHIGAVSQQRAIIVVAPEASDRAQPEARLVQSLAQGRAGAHIDAGIVVARLDPGEDLGLGLDGLREAAETNRQRIRDAIPPAPLARSQAPTTFPRRPTWRTLAAASVGLCCIFRMRTTPG